MNATLFSGANTQLWSAFHLEIATLLTAKSLVDATSLKLLEQELISAVFATEMDHLASWDWILRKPLSLELVF